MYENQAHVLVGGLASYGADLRENFARAQSILIGFSEAHTRETCQLFKEADWSLC